MKNSSLKGFILGFLSYFLLSVVLNLLRIDYYPSTIIIIAVALVGTWIWIKRRERTD
ncbi:MAG: hypothetical protein MJA31_07880 [Clostridia bacterium]|nr:hypothetical protein [Clostridia bacterium]